MALPSQPTRGNVSPTEVNIAIFYFLLYLLYWMIFLSCLWIVDFFNRQRLKKATTSTINLKEVSGTEEKELCHPTIESSLAWLSKAPPCFPHILDLRQCDEYKILDWNWWVTVCLFVCCGNILTNANMWAWEGGQMQVVSFIFNYFFMCLVWNVSELRMVSYHFWQSPVSIPSGH